MKSTRRGCLQSAAGRLASDVITTKEDSSESVQRAPNRKWPFVQIDVFTSRPLQGNALAVFTDARGLSDVEMQDLAREVNFQESTFVFPRPAAVERKQGIKVRIFTPQEELPFAGYPTLGTAMVLRNLPAGAARASAAPRTVVLDLKVGRIPVAFACDPEGRVFGDMRQVDPVFGKIHDRTTVATILGVKPKDICDTAPIQTVSTGLPFAIVTLNSLEILRTLQPRQAAIRAYFQAEPTTKGFYFVTRDTRDDAVGLRARSINSLGEDPATGSAAGCTASLLVRYGLQKSGETLHIQQGVEMHRPSHIYARAEKHGEKIGNVHIGGHAIEVAQGVYTV